MRAALQPVVVRVLSALLIVLLSRQLSAESVDGGETTGRLHLPPGRLPVPVVVVLWEELSAGGSSAGPEALQRRLLDAGFAVHLAPSSPTRADEPFRQRIEQSLESLRRLRSHPRVEPARIGLLSAGETGAWVATSLAAEDPALSFLALLSAPMESPEVYRLRARGLKLLEAHGLVEPVVDRIIRFETARWEYLDTGEGYDKLVAELGDLRRKDWFGLSGLPDRIRTPEERRDLPTALEVFLAQRRVDPLEVISSLSIPVLTVYGDRDRTMPATEFAVKLHFLAGALDLNLTVRTYADLGHDLTTDPQSPTTIAESVLESLLDWMERQVDDQRLASHAARPRVTGEPFLPSPPRVETGAQP